MAKMGLFRGFSKNVANALKQLAYNVLQDILILFNKKGMFFAKMNGFLMNGFLRKVFCSFLRGKLGAGYNFFLRL